MTDEPLSLRDVVLKWDATLKKDNLAKLESFTLERHELSILVYLSKETFEYKDAAKYEKDQKNMTKTVRIENADTNHYVEVVVEIWNKGASGNPDIIESSKTLPFGTNMFENYLTDTRYMVVKEVKATPK